MALDAEGTVDPGEYCRAVERHLCQQNAGHLVRIVGPAFELVCGWAARGVPLRVACHGIDRYVERQTRRTPRRRPIRIEFCEADVLDVFDEWRRATGAPVRNEPSDDEPAAHRRAGSLTAHLERVVARLTALQARRDVLGAEVTRRADDIARELDAARDTARTARGDARAALVARLETLDAELLDALRAHAGPGVVTALIAQARDELQPFKDRMTEQAFDGAVAALVARLLRERYQLPVVRLD